MLDKKHTFALHLESALKAHPLVWDNFLHKKDEKCFLFYLQSSFYSEDV